MQDEYKESMYIDEIDFKNTPNMFKKVLKNDNNDIKKIKQIDISSRNDTINQDNSMQYIVENNINPEKCKKMFKNDNTISNSIMYLNSKDHIDKIALIGTECGCNFDSQTAYVVKNIKDEPCESITILDFLNNKNLMNEIKNKSKYLVCIMNNELIKYESTKKQCHFKHKNNSYNSMSQWHKNWQNCFDDDNNEVTIGNRRADVLINNIVVEFQHSKITKNLVKKRNENYLKHNKQIYWVIDCNDAIVYELMSHNTYLIKIEKNIWKYNSFTDNEYVYLDINDRIFKINPNKVKSNMIDVKEFRSRETFVNSLKQNINIWNNTEMPQCTLYHNQFGAGCGKTYDSIQLLQSNDIFKHKTIFIYLTMMHSAKEVIYNELKEQYHRGALNKLEIDQDDDDNELRSLIKQYKIDYINKETKNESEIIIGTIDSFMFAIGNKTVEARDYFRGIVKSIRDGYNDLPKNGSMRYAKQNIKLNKECLIIIDEAQDLDPIYVEALCKIMRDTYIDAYIIGDKLQSIWGEHNIHTFLEHNELPNIKIIKNIGKNHVRRFHNLKFKNFVNNIIDFEKYNLLPIENICDDSNCKYIHDENIPYTLINTTATYANDAYETIVTKVNEIMEYVKKETICNNYLPNNFMFIFPILKNNYLATVLESKLQNYWIGQFANINYQKNVLKKNKYWKDKINDNMYHKYVYLHKSDDGRSINLNESENASRILSIHASKGNGCEVVFLLGLNEVALNICGGKTAGLVYDSFVHVAITRQKKSLYVAIENNNDDICERFTGCGIDHVTDYPPNLDDIKKSFKYDKIKNYALNDTNQFNEIYNYYKNQPQIVLQEDENEKDIIDWGHHIIRHSVSFYYIMFNIINNEKMDYKLDENNMKDQFKTIVRKISKYNYVLYQHIDYYSNVHNKTWESKNTFPILSFGKKKSRYQLYGQIILSFINNIKEKIIEALAEKKLPLLCPLETVIMVHIIYISVNGKYADISIMDLYSLIYCYDECSFVLTENHNDYKCKCKEHFKEGNNNSESLKYKEIRASIINHYEKINQINVMYTNYKKYITNHYADSLTFTYNIMHGLALKGDEFKIFDKFTIIAHSDKYIIHFMIKPQFNKLNINDIIFDAIFSNYMIANVKEESNNYMRYQGKKIITCIFALDNNEPYFHEFNVNNDIIMRSIKNYLLDTYTKHNKKIFRFYEFCKKSQDCGNNPILYTHNKIKTPYTQIPDYVINFFYDTNKKLTEKNTTNYEKTRIFNEFNDQKTFLINAQCYLEEYINAYFNIQNDIESDDFFKSMANDNNENNNNNKNEIKDKQNKDVSIKEKKSIKAKQSNIENNASNNNIKITKKIIKKESSDTDISKKEIIKKNNKSKKTADKMIKIVRKNNDN